MPHLAGTIRDEEIEAGIISRAIYCGLKDPKGGMENRVYPPASCANAPEGATYAINEGARIQLDPAFNLDSLDPYFPDPQKRRAMKIILKCWQDYGIVVKERSGRSVIYAENPLVRSSDPWPALGVDSNLLKGDYMKYLPWRVIDYSVFGAVQEEFP